MAEVGADLAGFGIMKYRDEGRASVVVRRKAGISATGIGSALRLARKHATTAGIELIFLETRAGECRARILCRARLSRTVVLPRYYGSEDAVRIGKDLAAIRVERSV